MDYTVNCNYTANVSQFWGINAHYLYSAGKDLGMNNVKERVVSCN